MRILGIDPGINGAAAIYSTDAHAWMVIDLPTVGQDGQRRINAPALKDWLAKYAINRAFLELAQAMPSIPGADGVRRGMGSVSSFHYGRTAGAIDATVACCNIPITYVTPQSWKRFYGLKGADKELSRAMAIQRFPTLARHLERKLDNNRAEAALIAYYGAAIAGAVSSLAPLDNPRVDIGTGTG